MTTQDNYAFHSIVSMYDCTPPATVPPCPAWCLARYCDSARFDYDDDGLAHRFHEAYLGEFAYVSALEQHHADGSYTLGAPEVSYEELILPRESRAVGVTPDRARAMAADLLEAVAIAERITNDRPANP